MSVRHLSNRLRPDRVQCRSEVDLIDGNDDQLNIDRKQVVGRRKGDVVGSLLGEVRGEAERTIAATIIHKRGIGRQVGRTQRLNRTISIRSADAKGQQLTFVNRLRADCRQNRSDIAGVVDRDSHNLDICSQRGISRGKGDIVHPGLREVRRETERTGAIKIVDISRVRWQRVRGQRRDSAVGIGSINREGKRDTLGGNAGTDRSEDGR